MATTPTQRTLKWLRDNGWTAAVVEKWNPHAGIRQDLFGIIDVIGIGEAGTIGVQSTSYSNISARVRKIEESEHLADLRKAGWAICVQGWRKVGSRWQCKTVDIS